MVHTTIKQALRNTLQDLSREDFLELCHQLKDRREEPRVRYRDVENKSVLQITDLLVSTFTERGALPVALGILKQINCNQEAETLYSETKACVDVKGDPTFRKTSSGELDTKPSQEALNHKAGRWRFSSPVTGKKPEEVEAEAKARVLSEGGEPCIERLVLSRFMIQFGQYKDQTFKWLLENDLSYAAIMVARHEKQRQNTKWQSPLMANKDSLTRYAIAYPEVLQEVRFHRGYERSLQSGQEGKALVGFGIHRSDTLQDLYESEDRVKISYVNFLRNKKSTCDPGSKMDIAVRYILQRDQKQAAASRKRRASSDTRTGAPPKVAAKRGGRPGVGGRGSW
ncbi:uncharacterized protein LOC116060112 isoform X1 [Sander lucioperca]|uniref:uncharacterized protein LOC116060112 isoform X1 n=1 Tax=Sander lucioperca TaxID=283035 RepID=UPI00125E3286|nr:uncharacterized protein LOC116060112 isoform X1 [Sander lucioperca]